LPDSTETIPLAAGDKVRAGRITGTVVKITAGTADVRDDGALLGRPVMWRLSVDALRRDRRDKRESR